MDVDELVEQMQRQQRRRRRITYAFIGALALAPFVPIGLHYYDSWKEEAANRLTPDEVRETRRLLDDLGGEEAPCQTAWRLGATRETLGRARLGGGCETGLMAPSPEAAQSYVQYGSIDGNYFGGWGLRVVRPGEPIGDSGECSFLGSQIQSTRAQLDSGEGTKETLAWAQRAGRHREGDEVVLLVDEEAKPLSAGSSFVPGRVHGRAYLYSGRRRRFVCGAEIDARSSANVDVRFSYRRDNPLDQTYKAASAARGALDRDLEVQLRRAVADGLRAITP